MKKEELLKLVNAGFTKDDIIKLMGVDEDTVSEESSVNNDVSTDNTTVEEGEVNVANTEVNLDTFTNMFDEMNKRLESMTKAIQSNNVLNASVDSVEKKKTNEDIISSIILPKHEMED